MLTALPDRPQKPHKQPSNKHFFEHTNVTGKNALTHIVMQSYPDKHPPKNGRYIPVLDVSIIVSRN